MNSQTIDNFRDNSNQVKVSEIQKKLKQPNVIEYSIMTYFRNSSPNKF